MAHKTAVEKLKEHEYDMNIKAQVRNFKVEITDNGDNTLVNILTIESK